MTYEDSVWDWVRWAWKQRFGDKELLIPELAKVCEIDKQRLYPIRDKKTKADQRTLNKIAAGLSVPTPTRETVLRFAGPPEKPRTALGWVREAGEAIRQAAGLLEREDATRVAPLTAAETSRVAAATEAKRKPGGEDSKAG